MEKKKEQKDKELLILRTIKNIDSKLDSINFDVTIELRNIYLGLTAD